MKADSKQKNVRLRNDSWFEVEDLKARWGCSRDMVLERAIHEAHESGVDLGRSVGTYTPADIDSLRELVAPTAPRETAALKRYTCDHCQGPRAVARIGEICATCLDGGHRDQRRDCRECLSYGTGGL